MPGLRLRQWTMPKSQTRAATRMALAAKDTSRLRNIERAARQMIESFTTVPVGPFMLFLNEHPEVNDAYCELSEALNKH